MIAKNYVVEKRILLALFFTSIGIAYFNHNWGFILFSLSTVSFIFLLVFERKKENSSPVITTKELNYFMLLLALLVLVSAASVIINKLH